MRFFRTPQRSGQSRSTKLDIELIDLALAAAWETLQSGGPASAMLGQLEALLASGPELTWRGNGPGLGRELRRSYSNIHGRYMGRYYLERHESVRGLLPIEGNNFSFDNARAGIHLKPNEVGDMPDWIGWDDSGFVVAEAKGTYAPGDWEKSFWGSNEKPQCVKNAEAQVSRVQIDLYGVARDVKFKTWVVASRWGTQNNQLDPWLVALAPPAGQTEVPTEYFQAAVSRMQRIVMRRALQTLGFPFGGSSPTAIGNGESVGPEAFEVPRDFVRRLDIVDDDPVWGVPFVVSRLGFSLLQSSEDLSRLRALPPSFQPEWAFALMEKPMLLVEEGQPLRERGDRRSSNLVARNGLAICRFEMLSSIDA